MPAPSRVGTPAAGINSPSQSPAKQTPRKARLFKRTTQQQLGDLKPGQKDMPALSGTGHPAAGINSTSQSPAKQTLRKAWLFKRTTQQQLDKLKLTSHYQHIDSGKLTDDEASALSNRAHHRSSFQTNLRTSTSAQAITGPPAKQSISYERVWMSASTPLKSISRHR